MKESFQNYFRELIGDEEAQAFFEAVEQKETRRGIRVNSLRVSAKRAKQWFEDAGYEVSESPFSQDGLEISGRGARFSLKLPYHAGWTYPQDPSSMFAVELLDPQPGETVIDLTAAPGGKTTHIAQRMENTGVLVANDHDRKRLKALQSNLARLGIWNALVTRMRPYDLAREYPEKFDRVLLDPSCSGEGLYVTYDGQPSHWSTKSLKRYASEQFGLLCSAFELLKPGGRLVYSTCTLNAVEDDGVVTRLLKKFPEAQVEDIEVPGIPEQIGELVGVRFWPHKTQTKGFFCVAITKTESLNPEPVLKKPHLRTLRKKDRAIYRKRIFKDFGFELPEDARLLLRDSHLFMVSAELAFFPLPKHYSLSFPIWKVREMRPTHAGALWMGTSAPSLELAPELLEPFFTGEILDVEAAEEDFHLLRFADFPLGVCEVRDGVLRPLIPVMH